jgi:ATP-dependent DNA ligase
MEIPSYLENNLPKYNTDANNNLKPMKCQPFKEKSMQYPAIIQPKLNGLRAVIRWEEWIEGEGMFATKVEGAKIRTKEGLEYVLPHITNQFEKKDFFEDGIEYVFDGELYKHGMPLNEIKASCPMTNSRGTVSISRNDPSEIEFHIFDLAIPDMPQQSRITKLGELELVRNKIVIVTHDYIYTDKEAYERRDIAISNGYEGIVIRNIHEEYAFGFRPSFIRKFKTHIDSEFLIVDLISKLF